MDLKALWSKKIGPVPVPIIALVLVLILGVVAWRMKASPGIQPEEAGEVPPADSGLEAAGDGFTAEEHIPPFVANPPFSGSPVPDTSGQVGQVDSNDQWLRRSIEWLAGQGHATADQARLALQKYLSGEQLSIAEGHLRDLAISHFGLPPELPEGGGTVPPVVTTPTPPTPPPVVTPSYRPPGYHIVTGASDDGYQEIAKLWYGQNTNDLVDLIQSYNIAHGHQGPFPVGTKLYVPPFRQPKYITATKTMRTASQIIAKNPPLNSVRMLQELNDGMKFPVAIGKRVRVA
jgi:hypothetical protein